ncbi:LPS export ABC transporter periplasmic protein LptC [Polymorphobacter fuscus]|uniref:LPS export ABC transporter periplasmic protein LptC n=1 Tax=Sandarakinorhabdus fusca TaxID=1439888 RepID=A0A7C9GWB9_9SPHN|nr:LPS export ABC transporter periplasmic protein LptC [Polymorphobacter fuscus]KAB7645446.1 LPS export ABC transporter periplasmic protein LptC [Polymorphobacter fuscus]MQT17869.1 LPS export ABC transporter periplasmic protein LptC [Polymorphobacter fuscus]NJC08498.1 lipopolysaccharide export system protein LptC [Polymorphobacter fuscus]
MATASLPYGAADGAHALTARQRAARPGGAHDTRVRLLKWLLPVLAFAVLAAIVIVPMTKVSEFSFLLAKDKVGVAAERLRIDNAVYRGETEKGEAFTISAQGAVQRSSAVAIVELTGLKAKLAMADGPATVTAPAGRYFIENDRLQVTGPVRLDSTAGYTLDSDTVDIDLNTRRVSTETPVTGTLPIGNFSAARMSGDIQGRTLVMDGGAHLRIRGRTGRAGR